MTVSVIIPAYNSEKTIERCIKSALNQTTDSIVEIIVVNDGSKDDTAATVSKIAEENKRVVLIDKPNGGVSEARNTGISNATGELIMFLDSDDELKPDYVEQMLSAYKEKMLVIGGIEMHSESGVSKITHSGEYSVAEALEKYGNGIQGLLFNGPWCKLYSREVLYKNNIRFDKNISLGEDTLFVFQYLKYCNAVKFIEVAGYVYYQIGTESLTRKFRPNAYENAKAVYKRLMSIASGICGEIPMSLKYVYKSTLLGNLRLVIANRAVLGSEYMRNTVKDYIEDSYVRELAEKNESKHGLTKLTDRLVVKRKYRLLNLLIILHMSLRGI